METFFARGPRAPSYLPHDDTEFEGHPPEDARSTEIAVENAKRTIRQILTEERRRSHRDALPDLAPQVAVDYLEPLPRRDWSRPRGPLARLRGFRADVRHVFWPCLFGLVIWQPLLVLVALFVFFCIVLAGQAVFGAERMEALRLAALDLVPARWRP